jgi:hypothetical protein
LSILTLHLKTSKTLKQKACTNTLTTISCRKQVRERRRERREERERRERTTIRMSM